MLHCLGGFVVEIVHGGRRVTGDLDYIQLIPSDSTAHLENIGWRPDSCGNSERLFRPSLPIPCGDGQQSWTCVIPVSEHSFADRSGLVEIHVTRVTSGEDLRRQLNGIHRQARINAAAVEVGGELHPQAALF